MAQGTLVGGHGARQRAVAPIDAETEAHPVQFVCKAGDAVRELLRPADT